MTAGGTELIRRRRWASGTSRTDGRTGRVEEWWRSGEGEGRHCTGELYSGHWYTSRLSDDTPTQTECFALKPHCWNHLIRLIAIMDWSLHFSGNDGLKDEWWRQICVKRSFLFYSHLRSGRSEASPHFFRIVRDPGFYARPKRFPRPGVKHVRKMISGVTEVLDQP